MKRFKNRQLALLAKLVLLCCILLGLDEKLMGWAQPCPKETTPFGGAPLDNSADELEVYWAVTDDDLSRITKFRYCNCCTNAKGDQEHFRGFEVEIYSPTSGF